MKSKFSKICISILPFLITTNMIDASESSSRGSLKRLNSQIHIPLSLSESNEVCSMKDEVSKFLEANKEEEQNKISEAIQNSEDQVVVHLLNIGGRLGFKRTILKNGKSFELLDISWPSIKEYAEKVIEENQLPHTGNVGIEDKELNLKDLEEIMPLLRKIKPVVHEDGENRTKADISEEDVQKMIRFCVGKKRLFYCGKDVKEDFLKLFSVVIKNYTGFQRIASMLVVSILNADEKYAFMRNYKSWRIVREDAEEAHCKTKLCSINIPLEANAENVVTFIHEAGHAYNAMLIGDMEDSNEHNISILTHSIINSPAANFSDMFFPDLTPSVFNRATNKIEQFITDKLDIEIIRTDIKRHIDTGSDFRVKSARIIYDMFRNLVLAGFGSRIFDLREFSSIDDYRFDSEKSLTHKNIARAMHIMCSHMRKAVKGDSYSWSSSNDNFFRFDEDESAESAWDGAEEMLAMIGMVPYLIEDKTFVINNKQNEFIAHKRTFSETEEISSELDKKTFRFHSSEYAKGYAERLKLMLQTILPDATVDEQFISEAEHIEYPKDILHTASEIVTDELKFEESQEALQLLNEKNSKIVNPQAYIDAITGEPISYYALNNRNSEFIEKTTKQLRKWEDDLNWKLFIASGRRDLLTVKELLKKGASRILPNVEGTSIEKVFERYNKEKPTSSYLVHLAVANGDIDVLQCLLDNATENMDINDITDSVGYTPLHMAVMSDNWEITKFLLERGAVNRRGKDRLSAGDFIVNGKLSLPRLSLNPIYKCVDDTTTKKEMDESLGAVGISLPHEQIGILQKKLQSEEQVTDGDLDTVLIEVDSQIPEIRKRQSEWNGIGHIYYLIIFTENISPVNFKFLLEKLKISDVPITNIMKTDTPDNVAEDQGDLFAGMTSTLELLKASDDLSKFSFEDLYGQLLYLPPSDAAFALERNWELLSNEEKRICIGRITPECYRLIKSPEIKRMICKSVMYFAGYLINVFPFSNDKVNYIPAYASQMREFNELPEKIEFSVYSMVSQMRDYQSWKKLLGKKNKRKFMDRWIKNYKKNNEKYQFIKKKEHKNEKANNEYVNKCIEEYSKDISCAIKENIKYIQVIDDTKSNYCKKTYNILMLLPVVCEEYNDKFEIHPRVIAALKEVLKKLLTNTNAES